MKSSILILVIAVAALSSCTSAYKTVQTPDDVYYSPARAQDEYVSKEDNSQYRYDEEYYSDRYLRMKVRNHYQWNDLDDWYYFDRYSSAYNYYYGSFNNPYNSWNYYHNPYCHYNYYVYSYPKATVTTPVIQAHNFNLSGYTNTNYNNINTTVKTGETRPFYNTNSNNANSKGLSNTIRTIFSRNNNTNAESSSRRVYSPSNNSSGNNKPENSSSGNNSGSGGVSRPVRKPN